MTKPKASRNRLTLQQPIPVNANDFLIVFKRLQSMCLGKSYRSTSQLIIYIIYHNYHEEM